MLAFVNNRKAARRFSGLAASLVAQRTLSFFAPPALRVRKIAVALFTALYESKH